MLVRLDMGFGIVDDQVVSEITTCITIFHHISHDSTPSPTPPQTHPTSPCPIPRAFLPKFQNFLPQWDGLMGTLDMLGPPMTSVAPIFRPGFLNVTASFSVAVQATRRDQSLCMPREPRWVVKLLYRQREKGEVIRSAWLAGRTFHHPRERLDMVANTWVRI